MFRVHRPMAGSLSVPGLNPVYTVVDSSVHIHHLSHRRSGVVRGTSSRPGQAVTKDVAAETGEAWVWGVYGGLYSSVEILLELSVRSM